MQRDPHDPAPRDLILSRAGHLPRRRFSPVPFAGAARASAAPTGATSLGRAAAAALPIDPFPLGEWRDHCCKMTNAVRALQ